MSDVIKKTKILLNPHPGRLPPPKSKFLSVTITAAARLTKDAPCGLAP